MTKQHKKFLNQLAIVARDVTPVAGARIASALVYRRNVIAMGMCEAKSHPLQSKYNRHPLAIYLHSEISCIKNAIRAGVTEQMFRNSTLYVVRQKLEQQLTVVNGQKKVTKKWTSGLACPCEGCAAAIAAFEIGEVIYSLDDSGFQLFN